jgi:hypothetical protein
LNTKALADAQFAAAMALGLDSRPAGFAPSLTGDIGKIDPTLKMMVDRMTSLTQSAVIQKAVRKAGALKALRVNNINETLTAGFCHNAEGTIQISGTNNYDDVAATDITSSYIIDITNCRDEALLTELSGKITAEQTESTLSDVVSASLTVDLQESLFADETFAVVAQRSHLSGTFSDSNQVTSGSMSANGNFSLTTLAQGATPETVVNHTFSGLLATRTATSDATSTTDVETINGEFTTGRFTGGAEVFKMTLLLQNLEESVQTITGPVGDPAVGTKNQLINGTVGMAWAPAVAGCQPGLITITMTAPRTFPPAATCPSSGAMAINNAIITFGSPIQVNLTSSAISQTFADCAEMDALGALCM